MTEDRAIRSICVVGDGIVGRTAALAFNRALPTCQVRHLATPVDPAALSDRLSATLPSIRRFHALLAIDERELVQRSIATHCLGTRFDGWSGRPGSWILAHGDYGLAADGVPFHHLWRRMPEPGETPFDACSLGAVLGSAGKFVHPRADPGSPLATFDYALRLDAARYADLIAERSYAAGIATLSAPEFAVERTKDCGIAALVTAAGDRIEADLFIDCTGSRRLLFGGADSADGQWEDWAALLPFDRIRFEFEPSQTLAVLDTATTSAAGWQAVQQLGGTTTTVTAGRAKDGTDGLAIAAGRLLRPWCGNVLAIGDAAIVLDPLLPVHLSLAHNAIERALAHLPGRDCHDVETAEYNRLTAQESDRVRDFAALFYLRSGRTDGIWPELAAIDPPPGLALTLDQYETRGRLPFFEQEVFDNDGWLAALTGLDIIAERIDPATHRIDTAVAETAIRRLAASYRDIARHAQPYPAYLAQMRSAIRR